MIRAQASGYVRPYSSPSPFGLRETDVLGQEQEQLQEQKVKVKYHLATLGDTLCLLQVDLVNHHRKGSIAMPEDRPIDELTRYVPRRSSLLLEKEHSKLAGEIARALMREWQEATGREITGKIGQQRFKAFAESLERDESPSMMRFALWGISESEWHAERGIDEFKVALSETQIERFAALGKLRLMSIQETRTRRGNDWDHQRWHQQALDQGYIIKDGVYVQEEEDENDRQMRLAVFGEPDAQTAISKAGPDHPIWDALERLADSDEAPSPEEDERDEPPHDPDPVRRDPDDWDPGD